MRTPASLAIALVVTASSTVASAQTTRLAPTGAPSGGVVRVQAGAPPVPASTPLTAGGAIEHPGCGGYVTARPQLVLQVSADTPWLRVFVNGGSDTALAILAPNGQWRCADDTYGYNPSVDGRFRRGAYRVWVATPTAGANASAVVTVTAERAQRPAEGAAGPVPVPIVGGATPGAVGAATGIFQNALQGLGGALQQPDAGAASLSPTQLTQLSELARAGLTAEQLQSVAGALGNARGGQPTLSPTQLTPLGQLARGGMAPDALQTAATSMLRGGAGR